MKTLNVFFLLFICWTVNGQNPKLNDPKFREEILYEYLANHYAMLYEDMKKIERSLKPLPYSFGDEFILDDTLTIFNHFTDTSLILDIDEGSYIPKGFKIKVVSLKNGLYFLEANNTSATEPRSGFVFESSFTDYFHPENKIEKESLYSRYEQIERQLKYTLTKKYRISLADLDAIVDSVRSHQLRSR